MVRRPCIDAGWRMADLIWFMSACGNSDHKSAIVPVTKGAAALVPPDICCLPFVPRLMIPKPGAIKPRWPMERPRFDLEMGRPRRSQAATGITPACEVITEFPTNPWFPLAATTITPRIVA